MWANNSINENGLGLLEQYIRCGKKDYYSFTDSEKENYILEALNDVYQWVNENNTNYKCDFIKNDLLIQKISSFDDFLKLPFLTKEKLRENPYYVCTIPVSEAAQIFVSTGTTAGKMIYMFHSWNDMFVMDLAMDNRFIEMNQGDIIINALPYEMSSSGLSFHNFFQHKYKCTIVSVGKGGYYSEPSKSVEIIHTLKPTVLLTTPTYAMLLAELYEQTYELSQLNQIFKRIILTGEGCSKALKNKLEKIYGCRCVTFYGSLEAGTIGAECLTGQDHGYHTTNSHIYLEIIDSEGNVVQDGERGEVVITTLLRKGSPLIRYKTGDLGYIQKKLCGCGLNERKLYICGRKENLIFIGEKEYSPFFLEEVLFNIDGIGNDYRFIIEDEKLIILLKQKAVKDISEDSKQKISKEFEDKTGIKNVVEIVDNFLYTGGKINRVIKRDELFDN